MKDSRPWIAILALALSCVNFVYTVANNHHQNKKVQTLSYKLQASQNRPLVRVVGQPEITKIAYLAKVDVSDCEATETKVQIDTKIRFRNEGKSNARVLLYAITDRLSGSPEIREAIFDKEKLKNMIVQLVNDYYKTVDLIPGAEHTYEVSRLIENVTDGVFNIHYLILYTNELDNLYDTYYWARFSSKECTIDTQGTQEELARAIRESIQFLDDHESHKTYSEAESTQLLTMHKALLEGLTGRKGDNGVTH